MAAQVVLHGYDIAAALGAPWPINRDHALLVLDGYSPTNALLVTPERAAGLTASYGVEVRGGPAYTVRFINGLYALEPPASGPVDCEISAEPAAFLLVGAGRLSRWSAMAVGLLSVGGAQPELAAGYPELFMFP